MHSLRFLPLPGLACALLQALLVLALLASAGAVSAQALGEQRSARSEMQAGRQLPIREILRQIIPRMQGYEYLGFEYIEAAMIYRLRFIRAGRVMWVDVDAQTARIIGNSN